MVLKLISFLVFFNSLCYAAIGEINPGDYYGALYPKYKVGSYGEVIDLEELALDQVLTEKIDSKLYSFQEFFTEELLPSSMCTRENYQENKKKIQVTYRFILLSLLYEQLAKSCQIQLNIVKNCKPQTKEMKGYLKTILESRNSELWKQNIICDKCSLLMKCEVLKNDFMQICSEKDMFYGMSYAPTLFRIIQEVPLISDQISLGCFRYYTLKNRLAERVDLNLKNQLRNIYETLPDRYPVGRFTLASILNQYQKRGVTVLSGYQPIETKNKKRAAKKIVNHNHKINNDNDIAQKTNNDLKAITKNLKKVPVKSSDSAFTRAVINLKELGLSRAKVDMSRFYHDYIFSTKKLAELKRGLKRFTHISSLKKMYKEDRLGSKESPVPLLFLKFLIDTKDHKSLYGLIQVLGDQFYVVNDLNPIKNNQIVLTELKNDEKVSFNWYLTVLEENER